MTNTWLDPEERAYPNGGFTRRGRALIRRNPNNPTLELPYGEVRAVHASIPDTYFTIPARITYRHRTIRGFLSVADDGETLTFTPEASAT